MISGSEHIPSQEVRTSLLPYPSSIGSIVFKPEVIGGRFTQGRINLRDRVQERLYQLTRQAKEVGRYYRNSEKVYRAGIAFTPIVGHIYHLYEGEEREWLSMIGPKEWGRAGYIASYRYDGEGWEEIV